MSVVPASSVKVGTLVDGALYQRLLGKILVAESGCWEWTAYLERNGYGAVQVTGRKIGAHRAMWQSLHGSLLDGLWVLHRCDNKRCINPDHLFAGTAKDNAQDRQQKGRGACVKGERNYAAILTDLEVEAVAKRYGAGESAADLAREFSVCIGTIHNWTRRHGIKAGRKGERNGRAKLKDSDLPVILARLATGESQLSIGRAYGVSGHPIWRIANGARA